MLDLLKHRKTQDCIIMDYAVHPQHGWLSHTGPLHHVAAETFKSEGQGIILEHMKGSDGRAYEGSEFGDWQLAKYRAFFASHDEVRIALKNPRELELQPMIPVPGKTGAQVDKKLTLILRIPASQEDFWKALTLAFQRCRKR
jgi:hypothetical protein